MKHYVGIDLGTTNSAICSFDGVRTRIWKSPGRNDVTPSAIFVGPRGKTVVGSRAYNIAPGRPGSTAMLFKRLMGTSTPVELPAVGRTMKPEECSAKVLEVLFGYVLEQLPSDSIAGTVITVPAAFNTMQKKATKDAAEMAGIGRVALMQEPVAAVMSVLKVLDVDGIFVIYDLGGGTLDVTVAQSIQREISILATGGIQMCGGRDFDRALVDNVVKPWLFQKFDLPQNWPQHKRYKTLFRVAAAASELAKIELSSKEETEIQDDRIVLDDMQDQSGRDIYIDIPLTRPVLDKLIEPRVDASIEATREALKKAGVTSHDVECLVFVGGPTHYKLLRDKVAFELGMSASTDVDPMTAVAEGAAIFAESVDWASRRRTRKSGRGQLSSGGPVKATFHYTSRTPEHARILARVDGQSPPGAEFQVDGLDDGWTSGRMQLADGAAVDVPLSKSGQSRFKVSIFGVPESLLTLDEDVITITKTAATVDYIPASHSLGVATVLKQGGNPRMTWLVREGDMLPRKGTEKFLAADAVKAGSDDALNFMLYQGESDDPADNRLVGEMKIKGKDVEHGVIYAQADLICNYEIDDSGIPRLEVAVPSIGSAFHSDGDGDFYFREFGQVNFADAGEGVAHEGEAVLERLNKICELVKDDPRLAQARQCLAAAERLDPNEDDVERVQEAWEGIADARRLIGRIRKDHARPIRQMDFEESVAFFDEHLRKLATPTEQRTFDNLRRSAQRAVDSDGDDFETYMNEMRGNNFGILWRQDSFVIAQFKMFESAPHLCSDRRKFDELVGAGSVCSHRDDIDSLRQIVVQLAGLMPPVSNADMINIIGR